MPPVKTYTFKHKISSVVTITIEVTASKNDYDAKAWRVLSHYVSNINDWTL